MTTHVLRIHAAAAGGRTPYARYLAASVGLMAIATANGIARELTYANAMGEDAAHWLSLLPMVALFGLYIWWLQGRWPLPTWQGAVAIGLSWAAIAAGFELGIGHWVDGKSWSELLGAYNVLAGGAGGVVLLVAAVGPVAVRRLRRVR
jgi:hypothetical protein